jgi:hypothetical protein
MKKAIKKTIKKGVLTLLRREKVAMLHPGRCGSTVLGSLINQHPSLFWSGEPFLHHYSEKPLTLKEVNEILHNAELMKISKVYSFATKYPRGMDLSYNCVDMSISNYVNHLKELGYNKFVFLERENYLRRALSMEKGRKTGVWHKNAGNDTDKSVDKIELNPKNFQVGEDKYISLNEYFQQLDAEKNEIFDAVGGAPLLYLTYERDIKRDPTKAYKKYCDFVHVSYSAVDINLRKTNPGKISSLVSNYEVLERYLVSSRYSWMLED